MSSGVRNRGQKLPPDQIVKSDIVVPSEDMSLEEAKAIMATGPVS